MTKRSRILPIAGIAAVLLVTFGVSVATGLVSLSESPPPAAPRTSTVPSNLAAHFAVLNGDTGGKAAAIAPSLNGAFTSGLTAQFGLNTDLAVPASNSGSQQVWVVPGGAGVCIYLTSTGSTSTGQARCIATEGADAGQLQMEIVPNSGNPTIYGLAPDTNKQVHVQASGATKAVTVTNNVYVVEVTPATESVAVQDSSGTAHSIPVATH